MKVLIALGEKETRSMLQLALEGAYGTPASEAANIPTAMKLLQGDEAPFDVVIAEAARFGKSLLSLRERQPNAMKALILWQRAGDESITLPANPAHVEVFDSAQEINLLFAAIARVFTSSSPEPSTDPERYCRISAALLVAASPFGGDIFIRLSAKKFLKIFNEGETFTGEDLQKYYTEKKIEHFYLRAKDSSVFLEKVRRALVQITAQKENDPPSQKGAESTAQADKSARKAAARVAADEKVEAAEAKLAEAKAADPKTPEEKKKIEEKLAEAETELAEAKQAAAEVVEAAEADETESDPLKSAEEELAEAELEESKLAEAEDQDQEDQEADPVAAEAELEEAKKEAAEIEEAAEKEAEREEAEAEKAAASRADRKEATRKAAEEKTAAAEARVAAAKEMSAKAAAARAAAVDAAKKPKTKKPAAVTSDDLVEEDADAPTTEGAAQDEVTPDEAAQADAEQVDAAEDVESAVEEAKEAEAEAELAQAELEAAKETEAELAQAELDEAKDAEAALEKAEAEKAEAAASRAARKAAAKKIADEKIAAAEAKVAASKAAAEKTQETKAGAEAKAEKAPDAPKSGAAAEGVSSSEKAAERRAAALAEAEAKTAAAAAKLAAAKAAAAEQAAAKAAAKKPELKRTAEGAADPAALVEALKKDPALIHATLHELTKGMGFTPEVQSVVKECVRASIAALKKSPKLSKLLKSIERDSAHYIASHSQLIAHLSCAIASQMEWRSESTFQKLTIASMMHDLPFRNQKLAAVPTLAALAKVKGEYTPEELAAYRSHPSVAAQLVRAFTEIPPDVDAIVEEHHERPDGTGFPRGLAHTRIGPLSAVFIVAHDLATYILAQEPGPDGETKMGPEQMSQFCQKFKGLYTLGTFKKVIRVVEKMSL